VVKCDLCNEEFANSEEVKRHKEQVHPMGDGKEPGLMENPQPSDGTERKESEVPEPAERATR
jgi:hypothetical protein